MSMTYVFVYKDPDTELETCEYSKGQVELEHLTDERVLEIHAEAIIIYKLYMNCSAVILKGEGV